MKTTYYNATRKSASGTRNYSGRVTTYSSKEVAEGWTIIFYFLYDLSFKKRILLYTVAFFCYAIPMLMNKIF